jgi:hypothetical protein
MVSEPISETSSTKTDPKLDESNNTENDNTHENIQVSDDDSDILNETIDVDDLNINDFGDRLPKSYSNEFNSKPRFRKLYGYDYADLDCEFETNSNNAELNDPNNDSDDGLMSVVQDIKSSVNNVLCQHKLSSFASNIEVILEETEEEELAEREYYNSLQNKLNGGDSCSEFTEKNENENDDDLDTTTASEDKSKTLSSEDNEYKNEFFEIVY